MRTPLKHPLFWIVWLLPVFLFLRDGLRDDGKVLWGFWIVGALVFTIYLKAARRR